MQSLTCCFIGERSLPAEAAEHITLRLNEEVERLIGQGVRHFLSGGARGFDLIAASLIVTKKEMGAGLRLDFILPCKGRDEPWPEREKKLYRDLLSEADGAVYLSGAYRPGCIKRRNQYLIDHSDSCICALLHDRGSAWQAAQYARRKGVNLIDVTK